MMRYCSLHSHSTYSYGDGYGPVEAHVERVKALGMTALALTEHGNVSSHVKLEKACRANGIKPIYGIEAYISLPDAVRKTHMILLAMNEIGYQNLNRLVTLSYSDEHKSKFPTMYWERLVEHNEGLIVLSGCADSELSCTLLGGKTYGEPRLEYTTEDFERALGVVSRYQTVFGDRYYLETQRFSQLGRTCVLNPAFALMGELAGVELAATCDVHYPLPTDNKMQTLLHAAHRGSSVAATEAGWEYDILLTYPTSDNALLADLRGTGLDASQAQRALDNTALIADRCTVAELPRSKTIEYPISNEDFTSWG